MTKILSPIRSALFVVCLFGAAACGDSADGTVATDTESVDADALVTPEVASPLYLVHGYDPTRDPFDDMADAVSRASAEGKQVIAVVGGDWCPDCVVMDQFIKDRPELAGRLSEEFIIVDVNLSEENENAEWLGQYPAFEWVPHFYVFNGDGELADSYDTRGLMNDGEFYEGLFNTFIADHS